MKPETKALKALLAGLGIPRGENTVRTGEMGIVTAVLLTDRARQAAVDHSQEISAAGYAVLVHVRRCGCLVRVWLCASSTPDVRRTVHAAAHDCPLGVTDLEPVTPMDWLPPIAIKE